MDILQYHFLISLPKTQKVLCTYTYKSKTCSQNTHPFRSNIFGHKVVFMHGSDPLANRGTGFRNFGDGNRSEFLIVNIGLNLGYDSVRNVFLD